MSGSFFLCRMSCHYLIADMSLIAKDIFAKIDPKDTVGKLKKVQVDGKRKRKQDGAAVG